MPKEQNIPKQMPLVPAGVSVSMPTRALGGTEQIPYDILRYIPQESAEHYRLAPLAVTDGVLEIGMVDPDDIHAIDALNFIAKATSMPFKVFLISPDDLERVLKMYRGLSGEVERAVSDLETADIGKPKQERADQESGEELLDLDEPGISRTRGTLGEQENIQEDAPTIKIVSTILRYAIDGKASDIHIEPSPVGVRVRYRVDGELHTSVILPLKAHRGIIARIKVLASMRLDEQRKPQDGRFAASIDGREIDFRVSTLPSYSGEKVVIRILDHDQGFISLDQIALTERNLALMRRAITRPHGLILISGPTGSGKSTTLYSMLTELDREKKNILSLEDPIEYYVEGVIQSQVRPEIGYTFANGLRTTLRQDPDVIMVGEIRDSETAKLAFQAALTGHLVLSTIHTNDAVGTISRLIDMGVEPYLIPPVLILSIAQRLTRTLCPGTGIETPLSASDRKSIETQLQTLPEKYRFPLRDTLYEPQKTPTCPTGMRGRMAVFEILEMSAEIEKIVLDNPVDSKLWNAARAQGMLTMREDAIVKAFDKKIPFSEVSSLSSLMLINDEAGDDMEPKVLEFDTKAKVEETKKKKTEETSEETTSV
ncbi:MAG TPA: GspE/PulE family protein [Candidatus Paceibacterota bacterium]|nr:GspE/PulE family protein [Candidatus Paceibacterota bacterium]